MMADLLEDEDGAPYPDDVQAAFRSVVANLEGRIAELEERIDVGVAQATVARGAGTSIVMALTGDPGAVVESDPYGRSRHA